MHTNEAFLNRLIQNHYKVAQEMTFAVFANVILAVVAFVGLPRIIPPINNIQDFSGLFGGSLFGGLGFIPGKEILDRREKARNLEAFRPLLQSLSEESNTLDEAEKQRIKEIFLDLIEKTCSC